MRTETTACCVVGGGPAGMMAGLLLASQGVDVIVLEKHEDFFRDFRGDTIHPATMQVMDELGILEEFLALRHTRMIGEAVISKAPSESRATSCDRRSTRKRSGETRTGGPPAFSQSRVSSLSTR